MANKRVYYAVHAIAIAGENRADYTAIHGVQTLGATVNFTLEQIYELGKLAIYSNVEGVPEVELTIEKVLDGHPLVYHHATSGAPDASLAGRSNVRCNMINSIFVDTNLAASGTPVAQVEYSGLYVSSLSYNFDVNGAFTEGTTLVGNNRRWVLNTDHSGGTPYTITGGFTPSDSPLAVEGVNVRQHFSRTVSRFPTQINGVSTSGTINNVGSDGLYLVHPQRVSVSANLGREQILELGRKAPYFRFITFPVEVTCEITIVSLEGDDIECTESGDNTIDQAIIIATEEGTRINLGNFCRLRSVQQSGGDAGQSSNVSLTYNYVTYNDFTVEHPNDPTLALQI